MSSSQTYAMFKVPAMSMQLEVHSNIHGIELEKTENLLLMPNSHPASHCNFVDFWPRKPRWRLLKTRSESSRCARKMRDRQ